MSRLPITLRLTLAFAGVMAILLGGMGLFVYNRMAASVDQTINDALRSRADDVTAVAHKSGLRFENSEDRLIKAEKSFVQVIDRRGRLVGGTSEHDPPVPLTAQQRRKASDEPLLVKRISLPQFEDDRFGRLLAAPLKLDDRRLIVVVGASLEERREALAQLGQLLLIGGPVALLLASLAGYWLARAALRPVETMGREAELISGTEIGRRLPLPKTGDEIRRLGERLNAMLQRLEAALARERTFVSDASHELRTPLQVLQAELELALREGRSPEQLREAVGSAAEETVRLVQLSEDLLVIARSDQGRLPIRRTRNDVADVLSSVAGRFRQRAAEAGRYLETGAPDGLTVLADRLRLEQALGNLVDNALRHGEGTVRLSAAEQDGRLELHVTDEGRGFPPEFMGHAFERFSRADEVRTEGGSGLGLAVVQAIALGHKGTANAANRADGGADVWLSVPAKEAPTASS